MNAVRRYEIGQDVRCTDGACGALSSVVVDPVAGRLSHLIVVPDGPGESRLVPIERAAAAEDDTIVLDCALAEFARMEPAVKTHFVDADDAEARYGYQAGEILSWPHYGLGGLRPGPAMGGGPLPGSWIELEDRVPLGEVRVRRGERVHARDGRIGRVRGLVVDPADGAVTHVLLDEGHLWGRKQVAIPIGAVGDITEEEVGVRLTRAEIKDLPPVEVQGLD